MKPTRHNFSLSLLAVLCGYSASFSTANPATNPATNPAARASQPPIAETPGTPLPQAHAHNDYAHDRPLFEALENGFCSVEADIFLVDGELLVGHERSELRPDRTLQSLYFEPLRKIVERNDGQVYKKAAEFQLLIDIKTDGVDTYQKLAEILEKYRPMLTQVKDGETTRRAVSVVISGNRPIEFIRNKTNRLAAIDGRLSDLQSSAPSHLIPLISDRWPSHFQWSGEGELPKDEREKLAQILKQAHAAGRKVRFWATPDNENTWRTLNKAGVDYINTDDLPGLAKSLTSSH